MSINLTLIFQLLFFVVLWMTCFGSIGYYIDRKLPEVAKKSALFAAILSIVPIIGIGYLVYLHLTNKKRLVIKF